MSIKRATLQSSHHLIQNLTDRLKKSIIGQDEAIDALVDYINISAAGLNDKEKPIGSFLFTGPTGVGKTELAKELAKELDMHFERFDMSEYSTERSSDNLIGGAAGLVGYENGGLLTNAIIENPNSIVLFDEIEKADKQVLNKLLQIMDYGVLTSSKGKKAYFYNTIIIFTSNLGAIKTTKRTVGFGSSSYIEIKNDMDDFLSPEFKARINQIIEFNSIDETISRLIVKKSFSQINKMLIDKNITTEATENLINKFISLRDEKLGARNLHNIIAKSVKTIIAKELIAKNIVEHSKVVFDWDKENDTYIYSTNIHITQINNSSPYFYQDYQEACSYAKANPGATVIRSACGRGFVIKELYY